MMLSGCRGRDRTFTQLIQSQSCYHYTTRQAGPILPNSVGQVKLPARDCSCNVLVSWSRRARMSSPRRYEDDEPNAEPQSARPPEAPARASQSAACAAPLSTS